ncbi:MFS transporter (plasmid) [Deinococcus sp. KNUC1210]|uniref:MFS transporter n=1 Tax=Deinococcus sp. KNUC1210 TaxID=2917691 RepID=UPI001EF10BAE|nr:MFS transporter [Deinococcus sp. KNUC1210]ULH14060.1 MFS transporter [Deinococcus sp. KNUC1210]
MTPATLPTRLWNRNFILWLVGTAQSALGTTLAGLALSFLVLHQTGSAGQMGVTLALGLLPALLSPLAGTLVDRIPLRLPLVAGNLVRLAIQLGVGLTVLHGEVNLPLLNILAFLNGLIGVIYGPASMSVLPGLVPGDQLARASGLLSSAGQGAALLGLVGGGVLVGAVGSAPSLIMDGVSYGVMALLVLFVRLPERPQPANRPSFLADLLGGLRYVRSSLLLSLLPVIALFINASLAPMEMLLPRRMNELGVGAAGYGLFFAVMTAGMLASSVSVAVLNDRIRPRAMSAAGLGGIALSLLLLALSQQAWQMWVLALCTGVSVGLTNTGVGVLFATLIQPEFRGRVASLLGMLGSIGQPLTLLALAPLADRISIQWLFGIAGMVTLTGAFVWAMAVRERQSSPQATG